MTIPELIYQPRQASTTLVAMTAKPPADDGTSLGQVRFRTRNTMLVALLAYVAFRASSFAWGSLNPFQPKVHTTSWGDEDDGFIDPNRLRPTQVAAHVTWLDCVFPTCTSITAPCT